MVKLTPAFIAKIAPPAKGSKVTYEGRGFGVRTGATGQQSYILNYRSKAKGSEGVERRVTIGDCADWSVGQARERAKQMRREIDAGKDPQGELAAAREAHSVADLVERYRREHLGALRPSTRREYERQIAAEILPVLGNAKVASIDSDDIDKLHRQITARGAPYIANRVFALLSRLFALSIRWKMRPDNPCRGLARNKEHRRERFLNARELDALLRAIEASEDRQAGAVFRLLLLTGCRRGEALSMRWQDLDLEAGTWSKPRESTKQNRAHHIPLSGEALDLLIELRAESTGSPFVFPGKSGGARADVNKAWCHVRKAAGLDLRLHDLRHSYASFCINSGLGLPVVQALLGHSTPSMTSRYSHLFDATLREATGRVGAIVGAAKPRLKVVS
jgi:integrase